MGGVGRGCAVAALWILTGSWVGSAVGQDTGGGATLPQDFAGDWVLNRSLSDDPAEQMTGTRGGMPRRGGETGQRDAETARVRRAMERFRIGLDDSTVVLAYPDRSLVIRPDGRMRKQTIGEDREMEYRARIEDSALVIERKLDGDVTFTEEYAVQEGTGRLHILTRIEGGRLPRKISFVRVYDPAARRDEPANES